MSSTPPDLSQALLDEFKKETTGKQFEWAAKHYYDLFAYHATQRLTAFNFFIVSLSFISTAYATLLMRSADTPPKFGVAAVLAFIAYLFVIAFGRLDKRNEQIINANERPLIHIQEVFQHQFGASTDRLWETFRATDTTYPLRTFGGLLPTIYILAALLTALGSSHGATEAGWIGADSGPWQMPLAALALWVPAVITIVFPLWRARVKERTPASSAPAQAKAAAAPAPTPPSSAAPR